MSANKIEKKIVAFKVIKPEDEILVPEVVEMHEGLKRPEVLSGSTYKIKPPEGAALYVTINDYVLDTKRVPYEIFINSKDTAHAQWVAALTMVISATFRKGGEVAFLVEELQQVFDPKGGHFVKGEGFVPSIVANIGLIISKHLGHTEPEVDEEYLANKKAEFVQANGDKENESGFPSGATDCSKCNQKAVIVMDGCGTCLNCGDSRCG